MYIHFIKYYIQSSSYCRYFAILYIVPSIICRLVKLYLVLNNGTAKSHHVFCHLVYFSPSIENRIFKNLSLSTLLHKGLEDAPRDLHEIPRTSEFNDSTRIHDNNAIEVHDGTKPMGNNQQCRCVATKL